MKWGKYFIGILLVFLVLGSTSVAPASVEANSSSTITKDAATTSLSANTTQALEPTSTTEAVYGETLKVNPHRASLMSNFNVNGDLMGFTDSLTTADPTDFWFFNVPTDRSILAQIRSSNPNYRFDLYSIDWSTGTASLTGFGGKASELKFATDLKAGDWGLRVTSTGAVGESYSIHMNAASPADSPINGKTAKLTSYSNNLIYTVIEYPNGDIKVNGAQIANTTTVNPNLNWNREFYFSYGGSYNSRTHDVSEVRVKSITTPVKYTSNYASSDNAVLIVLNEGTLFTYFESAYSSGNPPYYSSSFVDTNGRVTPRRLDFIDMAGDPDILVYDLDKKKVIDFASSLNYYYAKGIEPNPTVVYYN
ncbi:hypothetical protein HPL003_04470 [Paenibacillus terrae HPL-003]|uniref:Uncharacterized protein n=1 Tax=Paenibacillus terrae (strain HPL-003) TaxID=985665 RepID=G7VVM4_PAETH|nr:hypothetical protein [Paenibacillus terrae]AET57663.1 hypothetical protein HPL003_04470 [Paenibacillus terrae HPL-003]